MAQKESQGERAEKLSLPNPSPAEFAEAARKRIEEFVQAQTELLEKLQQANRQWFDRVQSEANLAGELASKLTTARSVPEVMTACQEWTSQRFKMMAEDGKQFLADTEKFMEAAARLLPHGWPTKGPGAGT